jgi:2',3'-cyclic-nucleotide 2'-phosphodiesterase (5'-nucleotidase family)
MLALSSIRHSEKSLCEYSLRLRNYYPEAGVYEDEMHNKFFFRIGLLLAVCIATTLSTVQAAPVGRASAAFDNARPDKSETAWGRLVADALKSSVRADLALVNAGALNRGTLAEGDINSDAIATLLAFPDDEIVTLTITGAQLRAALERAVQAYPTASSAWLHGSGFAATFNTQASTNRRITLVRVNGREVQDDDSFSVAMPISLAKGGAGYFTIWNDPGAKSAKRSGTSLSEAVMQYIRGRGTVSPDDTARLAPQ